MAEFDLAAARRAAAGGELEAWVHAICVGRLVRDAAPPETYPPLLVRYEQGQLVITDGNHRHAAFALRGLSTCWVVIWYPRPAELAHHEAHGFGWS